MQLFQIKLKIFNLSNPIVIIPAGRLSTMALNTGCMRVRYQRYAWNAVDGVVTYTPFTGRVPYTNHGVIEIGHVVYVNGDPTTKSYTLDPELGQCEERWDAEHKEWTRVAGKFKYTRPDGIEVVCTHVDGVHTTVSYTADPVLGQCVQRWDAERKEYYPYTGNFQSIGLDGVEVVVTFIDGNPTTVSYTVDPVWGQCVKKWNIEHNEWRPYAGKFKGTISGGIEVVYTYVDGVATTVSYTVDPALGQCEERWDVKRNMWIRFAGKYKITRSDRIEVMATYVDGEC